MQEIIRSNQRGYADHGWLKSFHSFSFADYHNPQRVEFGPLRVINEDRVQAGAGFGTHGHRDMEIISYVLAGQLAHKDSLGNGSVLRPGDVQRMSAGSGVQHSEFNPSPTEPVHFLQIWIQPNVANIAPSYEEKCFADSEKRGRLRLVASADGSEGSVRIHQDARLFAGLFDGNESAVLRLPEGRGLYIHVARGSISANTIPLETGDALQLSGVSQLELTGGRQAEVLVFDLPAPHVRPSVVVTSTGQGLVQQITAGQHRLASDEPTSAGGFDQGPDPYALLLASLGSCTAMTLQLYARRKSLPLKGVRVELHHAKINAQEGVTDDKPVLMDSIERRIELDGPLSMEQRESLLVIANKCPIYRTLTSQIKIDTSLAT